MALGDTTDPLMAGASRSIWTDCVSDAVLPDSSLHSAVKEPDSWNVWATVVSTALTLSVQDHSPTTSVRFQKNLFGPGVKRSNLIAGFLVSTMEYAADALALSPPL